MFDILLPLRSPAPAAPRRRALLQAGFCVLVLTGAVTGMSPTTAFAVQQADAAFVCPMHPEEVSHREGTCSKCGMALVRRQPADATAYEVELTTTPAAPAAGQPFELRFTVRAPKTRAIVRDFVVVHERPYHVFLLSQDLSFYDHLHPVQQADGSYTMKVTLPTEGHYKVYSDFLPRGGKPQVIATALATAGARGDAASAMTHLVPDTTFRKTYDTLDVTLVLPEGGLVAGRPANLRFTLADAKTGAPVRDLQPYLGAFGHTLILSEDTEEYVHAHPEGKAVGRGGPALTFHALFPREGRYRIWTQFKRHGLVSTTIYTVAVAATPAPTGADAGARLN